MIPTKPLTTTGKATSNNNPATTIMTKAKTTILSNNGNRKIGASSSSSPAEVSTSAVFSTRKGTVANKMVSMSDHAPTSHVNNNNNNNNNVAISSNKLVSALGPISLLGGTAAVYTSVLQHPSSTVTPLSVLYMILLALQYSIQPKLSQKYISSKTSKQSVAFCEEVTKTTMAMSVVALSTAKTTAAGSTAGVLSDWTLSSSLTVAGLPAILYAAQGVLQYQSQQHLDAVTYNGLTQTKTLFAAICCFLLLGKQQSMVQMGALLLLLLSSLLFQGIILPSSSTTTAETTTKRQKNVDFFAKGVVPCLIATFLSGLAGALSQKGLQYYNRDAYVYTMEISIFSALTLLGSMFFTNIHNGSNPKQQLMQLQQNFFWLLAGKRQQQKKTSANNTKATTTSSSSPDTIFHGWTKETWIPILLKAFGGVLTALVHKHAGSVSKGFALMFGLVLSGCFATIGSGKNEEGPSSTSLKPHQWWGTILVLVSGWMHFTHPPK